MLGGGSVGIGCNGWGGGSKGRCNRDKREITLRYAAVIVSPESIHDRILDSEKKRGGGKL